jgi:hypothetical protein
MGRIIRPPFVPFTVATVGTRRPRYFVHHTTESNGTIEGLAAYFRNDTPRLGINYITQASGRMGSLGSFVAETQHVQWHNSICIGCENMGFHWYTEKMWFTRLRQLWAAAWISAWVSQEMDIPLRIGALNRRWVADSGFCEHRDVPDNDHVDCGPGFPLGFVLQCARKWQAGGVPVWVRTALPKS